MPAATIGVWLTLLAAQSAGRVSRKEIANDLIGANPCEIRGWFPTNSTSDFQRAIDACSAFGKRHLGRERGIAQDKTGTAAMATASATLWVLVNVTVGSIVLPSDFTLHINAGVTMHGSLSRKEYPLIAPLPSYGTARDNAQNLSFVHRPLIYVPNRQNVRISGGGTVDGQGGRGGGWWAQEKNGTLEFQRPRLVQFVNTTGIRMDGGLTLANSPFWTVHLVYSTGARFENISIAAPRDSPNTDGIDVDSSNDVLITDCTIDVGDDAVAVKSGLDAFGRAVNIPSANVLIQDNRIYGKAIAIGSEMSGGVYNVTARRNVMGDPRGSVTGFLVKSQIPRGGLVSNITFADSHLLNVSRVYSWIPALVVSDYYGKNKPGNSTTTPRIERITFKNIVVDFAEQAGCLMGLPGAPLKDIRFQNVTVQSQHMGWACEFCEDCDTMCKGASTNCSF